MQMVIVLTAALLSGIISAGAGEMGCPYLWDEYDGMCFHIFRSNPKSWGLARQSCAGLGANLMSIHNEAENNQLKSRLESKDEVWIGFYQITPDADYSWQDGSATTYTNWLPSEPNNWKEKEDCGIMWDEGSWHDDWCTRFKSYACSKTPACPVGWEEFGGRCFSIPDDQTTWELAQLQCAQHGGSLASVPNSVDNLYIKNNVQGQFWIGLHQTTEDAPFTWVDGCEVTYTNWNSGEPNNNAVGGEDCVVLNSGGSWSDESCAGNKAFICALDRADGACD